MKKFNTAVLLPGLALAVLFAAGIFRLFVLRFKAGDIYPPYSSLRADPLGAKALYQSLARLPRLSVARNYKDVEDLDLPPETALLFLGDTFDNGEELPAGLAGNLNRFVRQGGRLVVTLLPLAHKNKPTPSRHPASGQPPAATNSAAGKAPPRERPRHRERRADAEPAVVSLEKTMALTNWLGLALDTAPPPAGPAWAECSATNGETPAGLPRRISCHTAAFFTNLDSAWNVVYRREDRPVIVERRLGRGSVALSTLSYFASNEALRDERHAALLAWLTGPARRIVFDEQHLGVGAKPGLGTLARRYRLYWPAGGLIVLGLLFVWQNSVGLVPPPGRPAPAGAVEVAVWKDSAAGLVNLLRRNIPGASLLPTCVNEWMKTLPHGGGDAAPLVRRVRDAAAEQPAGQRPPARVYNEISRIINERRPT